MKPNVSSIQDLPERPAHEASRGWSRSILVLTGLVAGCLGFAQAEEPAKETGLPRILLIGDSICGGYHKAVTQKLEGTAVVVKNEGNAEWTGTGLEKIDAWLGDGNWDIIHFNWGLWDIYGWRYFDQDRSPKAYAERLDRLVTRMKKTRAKLIWATTTPACPGPEKTMLTQFKKEVVITPQQQAEYHEAALAVMKRHGVEVNDLYNYILPDLARFSPDPDNVHFNGAGNGQLAKRVSEVLEKALDAGVAAASPPGNAKGIVWDSPVPDDCPFERSPTLSGVYFTGRHSDYKTGDTFYPSWASDGNLYSPWTDGVTDGVNSGSGDKPKRAATTGHAVMLGDDPLQLTIKNTSPPKEAWAKPYRGRYPCGSLVHNGVWYYGTYCLGPAGTFEHRGFKWNWPNLGPMPGFQISRDLGKTWAASPLSPEKPLFPEPEEFLGPVKMGAPHFVDFGRNMEHSPDGKAYLIGMGAEVNDPHPRPCIKAGQPGTPFEPNPGCTDDFAHANLSWISADQAYLARVRPSPETINEIKAYEFFAGHDASGKPLWTSDYSKIKPLIEWNNHMGCVTATYVPGLRKYLMCVTDGWPTVARMNSYILEADAITGPWRMVAYLKDFGEQAYFLNFPSKFISADGKSLWLCYSANFSPGWNGVDLKFNPPGGRYGLCLHELKLLSPAERGLRRP